MMACSKFKIAAVALFCGLLLSNYGTSAAETETNPTVAPCIHLLRKGQKYSLSYFGQKCPHQGYIQLPEDEYDAAASWAFNASYAKVLSEFDRFRILARLSTVDLRGETGFAKGPCNFGPWADYKWADHAAQAFYCVSSTLGETPLVTDTLVMPILKLGIARRDKDSILEFKESKKLSDAKRSGVVRAFRDAENTLSTEKLLLAVPLTIDDAAKPEPRDRPKKNLNRV